MFSPVTCMHHSFFPQVFKSYIQTNDWVMVIGRNDIDVVSFSSSKKNYKGTKKGQFLLLSLR